MLWLLGERQRYRVFAEKITATRVNKGLKLSEVMKRDCRTVVRSQPKSKNLDLLPARNLFPALVLIARTDFLSGKKKKYLYRIETLFLSFPDQMHSNSKWVKISLLVKAVLHLLSGLRDSARTSAFLYCLCSIPSSGWRNTPVQKQSLKADSWALSSWGKEQKGANISTAQMAASLLP